MGRLAGRLWAPLRQGRLAGAPGKGAPPAILGCLHDCEGACRPLLTSGTGAARKRRQWAPLASGVMGALASAPHRGACKRPSWGCLQTPLIGALVSERLEHRSAAMPARGWARMLIILIMILIMIMIMLMILIMITILIMILILIMGVALK